MTQLLSPRSAFRESTSSLSAAQLQMDAISHEFSRPSATHLLAMMGASLLGRVVGLGVSGFTSTLGISSWASRGIYQLTSLFGEVAAYRSFIQGPQTFEAKGFANDLLSFGMLRSFGRLGRNSNPLALHALQSGGLVLAQNLAANLDWVEKPEGSLIQQLVHAEIFNLQQASALSLMHLGTGNHVRRLESNLEIFHRAVLRPSTSIARQNQLSQMGSNQFASDRVKDAAAILEVFERGKTQRLERIRERLLTEAREDHRSTLESEAKQIGRAFVIDIASLVEFFTAIDRFYMRHILKGTSEGLRWTQELMQELVVTQSSLHAYDLFIQQKEGVMPAFLPFCRESLPPLQRWKRAADAPILVKDINFEYPLDPRGTVYVNLHKVHSYQDVVGDGDIDQFQREIEVSGRLKNPLQLSYHPGRDIFALSDGNHHALAALRAGYDFAKATYMGRLNLAKFQPVLLRELRIIPTAELLRLIEERGGGGSLGMGGFLRMDDR